ncbi:hypothetical protein N9R43_01710 [bacterium]|nr:hypothetical protein [bacterium]
MKNNTDIDIDLVDRDELLALLPHVKASIRKNGIYTKHNSGVYVHEIPSDAITNLASIEYKEAEERGYFKLDFLNNSLYRGVKNEKHLTDLMAKEPVWDLLLHKEVVENLAHVANHIDVLRAMRPQSIISLAEVLAIIRPAKRYLLGASAEAIKSDVWKKPEDDSYYFKKAHAVAYAVSIIVQLNLFCEQVEQNGA